MTPAAPRFRDGWLVACLVMASAAVFMDGSAVSVALPAIDRELQGDLAGLQWIVAGYTLTLASLLVIGGVLGDRLGRKRVLLAGMVLFGAASAFCGLAPSFEWLIAGRLVQGVGAAMLTPQPLAIFAALYRDRESRGRAIGTWAAATSIFTLTGPILGGVLVDTLGWRWVFFINPLFLAPVILLTLRYVPETREATPRPLAILPPFLLFLGLAAATSALIALPGAGPTAFVTTLGLGGLGLLVAWFLLDGRSPSPMIPRVILFQRNLLGANVTTLLIYQAIAMFGIALTLFIQGAMGLPAILAGLATLPVPILIGLGSRRIGTLAGRYGPRWFLLAGCVIAGSGGLLFTTIGPESGILTVILTSIVIAAGATLFVSPISQAAVSDVPQDQSGAASGLNNFAARLASLLGFVLLGLLSSAGLRAGLGTLDPALLADPLAAQAALDLARTGTLVPAQLAELAPAAQDALRQAYTQGFHTVMLAVGAFFIAGGVAAGLIIRNPVRPPAPAPDPAPGPPGTAGPTY